MRISVFLFLTIVLFSSTATSSLLPLQEELHYRVTLQLSDATGDEQNALLTTIYILQRRLDKAGVKPFRVATETSSGNRIRIELVSAEVGQRVRELLINPGKLELLEVVSPVNPAPVQLYKTRNDADASIKSDTKELRVLHYPSSEEDSWIVVTRTPVIVGDDLRNATAVGLTGGTDDYRIMFYLKKEAAERFRIWTAAHLRTYLAVSLNDEIKSVAFIRGEIFDTGQIAGRFTKPAAEDLANVLSCGTLPVTLKIVSEGPNN
jgi:protein-export membrane protein SecD